jgi:hypothetical protein
MVIYNSILTDYYVVPYGQPFIVKHARVSTSKIYWSRLHLLYVAVCPVCFYVYFLFFLRELKEKKKERNRTNRATSQDTHSPHHSKVATVQPKISLR